MKKIVHIRILSLNATLSKKLYFLVSAMILAHQLLDNVHILSGSHKANINLETGSTIPLNEPKYKTLDI